MKERKPRIKKTRKPPIREKKPADPLQVGVPWGRAASEHRPGLFTKQYLTEHAQACAADIFYGLRRNLEAINKERIEIGEKPIRGCTYNSFAKYWHWFKFLGLVESVDKREASIYDFLKDRRFFRLTDKGKGEVDAFADPIRAAHPELR